MALDDETEIRALTGLRGIAALDVAFMHIKGTSLPFLNWLAFHSPAVDVFFCLSGFTLCLAYQADTGRPLHFRNFLLARFARVYPLYFCALVVAAIYSHAWNINNFSAYGPFEAAAEGIRQILMINALPIVGTGAHWIDPMWSLSIEAFCYVALFPVLFLLSCRVVNLDAKYLLGITCVLGLVTFAFYALFYNPGVNSHQIPAATGPLIHWVAIVRGICMFTAGWLAYLVYRRHPGARDFLARATGPVSLGILAIIAAQAVGIVDAELLVVLAPLLVIGICGKTSIVSIILSCRPLHYFGRISYSVYIVHWIVMAFVWRYGQSFHHNAVLRLCVTFALSLLVAALSYHCLERPTRFFLRRLFDLHAKSATLMAQRRGDPSPT